MSGRSIYLRLQKYKIPIEISENILRISEIIVPSPPSSRRGLGNRVRVCGPLLKTLFTKHYLWPEQQTQLKIRVQNHIKMVKIDTLFVTKTAENPTLWVRTYSPYKEVVPSGDYGTPIRNLNKSQRQVFGLGNFLLPAENSMV